MAWYEGEYSCGHEGRINIIGPGKDREWKKERAFSGVCPECYKKWLEEERQKTNLEAAEKSAEMELPELTGSEKQVAWANELRLRIFENLTEYLKKLEKYMIKNSIEFAPNTDITSKELHNAFDWFMISKTEAKYWIGIRETGVTFGSIVNEYRVHLDDEIHEDVLKEIEEEKENRTVSPETENPKSGIVEIEYKDNTLFARYIKDDDFIKIVKKLGYKWEGVWCKKITEYTGTVENRVAELGNILLTNGFTIQFPNVESKERAISADFVPENDRWILYNTELGKLSIFWNGRNNILYENAKRLPSAKWSNGSMGVNVEFYQEVEDFAETMGFSISKRAKEEIEKYKQKESKFETANVTVKNDENISDRERIEKSLKSDGIIIKDLIDA